MKQQSRREFFKKAGLLGAALTGMKPVSGYAGPQTIVSEDRMGVLVDTTSCIGCRRCEHACKSTHQLPTGEISDYDDTSVFNKMIVISATTP